MEDLRRGLSKEGTTSISRNMKKVTILILGSFGKGSIENYYKRGFEKAGMSVDTYGSSEEFYKALGANTFNKVLNKISPKFIYNGINKRLLSFINGKKYNVILVFKGMELYEETVLQLKQHADLLTNYNCDHPFVFYSPGSGNSNVKNSIKVYDIHFSYSRNIVRQLQQQFNKEAYFIPFGYDNEMQVFSASYNNPYKNRFLFIGAYDKYRGDWLADLALPDLDIYGDTKWRTRNLSRPFLLQAYRQKALYDNDYIEAVNNSSGVINLLRDQNVQEQSHNMRTFEVPGYGGVLISQRTSEQMEFFDDNKEAIFFDSKDELLDKIDFLRRNPSVTENIKQAAHFRSQRCNYSYDARSVELLSCLTPYLR